MMKKNIIGLAVVMWMLAGANAWADEWQQEEATFHAANADIPSMPSAADEGSPCIADADCDDDLFCNGEEICLAGFCVEGAPPCAAEDTCSNQSDTCIGSGYSYTVSGGKATITGYNGSGGDVDIPETIAGYPVVSISSYAFQNRDSITSITVSDSVTTIGYRAFDVCDGLTTVNLGKKLSSQEDAFHACSGLLNINVDSENTFYESVDGILYNEAMTVLVRYPLRRSGPFVVPDTVIVIGDVAFAHCTSLTDVTIPDSVTTIGYMAFNRCYGLTSLVLPDSLTSLGGEAFSYAWGLTSVTIPASVTSMASYVFYDSYNLSRATFLGDAPSIGTGVFRNTSADFSICYTPGAARFTSPTWAGYPASACACADDTDCADGEMCVDVSCESFDNPPALGEGPFVAAGPWPVMSTSSDAPTYLNQNRICAVDLQR